jgi:hypothetical protein
MICPHLPYFETLVNEPTVFRAFNMACKPMFKRKDKLTSAYMAAYNSLLNSMFRSGGMQ